MAKKEMIAMILAGGQGSRLGVLTNTMAKPAIPFGSRYRIIDFPLSNCTNSGIDTVGVLTQYQPLELNTYVGNGHPWDLDRNNGGAFILPPYQNIDGSDWYTNTANAIFQNIGFIDNYNPNYVLILSGDHIYKMNYEAMLETHLASKADCTIAVLEVPWSETYRFGIMNTDETDRIVEFEEKPANAKSNLASMGIYIFSWPQLRRSLIMDNDDSSSSHDFGKNIIPMLISKGMKVQAYRFSGYWKDVGTISSLWESHMDLLDHPDEINFRDPEWRIYSRNPVKPAHFIAKNASVKSSCMTDGCRIYGEVSHSILGHSVVVEEGAVVKDCVLMPGAHIGRNCHLEKCIVGLYTHISDGVAAGAFIEEPDNPYINKYCTEGITVFNHGLTIKANVQVPGNAMVDLLPHLDPSKNVIEEIHNVW
ncbi:MAG: glucose-1-phosphate adenylyltransferase [Eubacteriales bacterium]|nr:glucose-1-phosphate adenylyltransferase [Eubacteriales bacterium]